MLQYLTLELSGEIDIIAFYGQQHGEVMGGLGEIATCKTGSDD